LIGFVLFHTLNDQGLNSQFLISKFNPWSLRLLVSYWFFFLQSQ